MQDNNQKTLKKDQARDTGMAMVLIFLLIGLCVGKPGYFMVATALLILDMTWPTAFTPVAKVWFGLSHVLGTVVSKILLSIVFFALVMPVGLIRRLMGKNSLKIAEWKNGDKSAFVNRDHLYTASDIENPY